MPTYDYRCTACGHEFEAFQSMSAPVLKKCPKCGKAKLERLIGTGAGIIFKGSGFYETDYRSDSYKKAAEADSKSGSTGDEKPKGDTAKNDAPADAASTSKSSSETKTEPAAKPSGSTKKPSTSSSSRSKASKKK